MPAAVEFIEDFRADVFIAGVDLERIVVFVDPHIPADAAAIGASQLNPNRGRLLEIEREEIEVAGLF
jgi:hypothetical protein